MQAPDPPPCRCGHSWDAHHDPTSTCHATDCASCGCAIYSPVDPLNEFTPEAMLATVGTLFEKAKTEKMVEVSGRYILPSAVMMVEPMPKPSTPPKRVGVGVDMQGNLVNPSPPKDTTKLTFRTGDTAIVLGHWREVAAKLGVA